jgi:hypothetical protein
MACVEGFEQASIVRGSRPLVKEPWGEGTRIEKQLTVVGSTRSVVYQHWQQRQALLCRTGNQSWQMWWRRNATF